MERKYNITFGSQSQHAASLDDLAGARKIVDALRKAGHNPVMVNGQAPFRVWGNYVTWDDTDSLGAHVVNRGAW